ncbi:hypothetical protein PS1_032592 [Malus domestica]
MRAESAFQVLMDSSSASSAPSASSVHLAMAAFIGASLMPSLPFTFTSAASIRSSSASLSSAASLIEFLATAPRSKPKRKKFTTRTGKS